MNQPQKNRRRVRGVVVSDRTAKTIGVRVTRRFRHPKYGKMVRTDRVICAHDEAEAAHLGDVVEIVECRPMSRTKRWRLAEVVERNPDQAAVAGEEVSAGVVSAEVVKGSRRP